MEELNDDTLDKGQPELKYDGTLDDQMEERQHTETIRDSSKVITIGGEEKNPIQSYKFCILVRDKPALEGELSREEMNLIYNLYSNEGANLTQRATSRYFPNFTFRDFKRILRAFNITKDCLPFAPHVKEEHTIEQMEELYYQNKDNNFLRKLEQHRFTRTLKELNALKTEHKLLKDSIDDFTTFASSIKFAPPLKTVDFIGKPGNVTMVVYLSDMHIGADVSSYSIYDNVFGYETAKERMLTLLNTIYKNSEFFGVTNLIICNMGDSLDGLNGHTSRGGHTLPQNMNNKDQFDNYVRLIVELFDDLYGSGRFETLQFISTEGGNHDGDVGYMANVLLEKLLPYRIPNIKVRTFKKFIEYFTVGNHAFILCHGKDAKDMFRGLPLTLNDKTHIQIKEFIDYNKIKEPIVHFIKGDLHQSATTFGKDFRYKSVSSFFGSSEWIHKNFGNTKAGVDYDIVVDDDIFEGKVILN